MCWAAVGFDMPSHLDGDEQCQSLVLSWSIIQTAEFLIPLSPFLLMCAVYSLMVCLECIYECLCRPCGKVLNRVCCDGWCLLHWSMCCGVCCAVCCGRCIRRAARRHHAW